ncbi:aldehyde dehydrogenase family protein [Novosphingobium pentaromativorans]|nr:aldehyde dehydrogenase family protein [Novosphingobium pentaromativorans]AIT82145.1 aldehyde dehydrogenase [Novosphingobium pentaromativorans US6-1]
MTAYAMVINGERVAGASSFPVLNPADETAFAQCPKADKAQLEQAIAAAKAAFPGWAATPIEERAQALVAIGKALESRAQEFAGLITREQGKPIDQAMFEVMGSVAVLMTFAGMRLDPQVISDANGRKVIEHRTPLGVVAAITPWNYPLILHCAKVAPALMAGNSIVAKPAPTTPLATLKFVELCADHLPAGVLNVICDENDLGAELTSHPDVAKVSFTGSTPTGKKVVQAAAGTLKRTTLELGGNDAAIVLDDVDPVAVARHVFQGAMGNAGQICFAIKRAYVPSSLYEDFCAELARLASEAIVDDGAKQGTQVGPLQNAMQFEKVKGYLADAKQNGKVIAGGAPLDRPGYFIAPTIVRDIADDAKVVREEQFGPILPVLKYDDIDDVIARANDSEFGLSGTVWGKDVEAATAIAMRVDAGTVWVNQHMAIDFAIPFRGAKQSGIGGEYGQEGLHEYTQAHIVNAVELSDA